MVCSLKNLINSVFPIIFNTYEHNRLKTVKDRKGKVVETYTYNIYGEVASVTDALGNVTTYEYDNTGRLTNVVMKAKDADKAASTTAYGYDKAGNILTQTDGNGNVTKYEYSAHGRLMSVTNADGNAESYVYDAFGNVTEKTDGNGTVVLYQYDNRNNLTQVSYDDKIIAYSYDKMNNRTSMDDESGEYAYTYDNGNRLVSVTKDDAAYLAYEYDKLGNVTKANHLTYTYDACGRMTSANDVAYTYDEVGNLATTTYPTGSVTYAYDKNNRVTNVANKVGEEILTSYAYTYYDNGMEKSKDDDSKLIEYTYDGAGRLKTVTETDKETETVTRTATYTYDNAGNRESLVEVCTGTDTVNGESIAFAQKRTGYLYNEANVITLEREIYQDAAGNELASKNTRYVYDNAGNLISTTVEYVTEIPEEATADATEAIEVAEDATEEATDDIKIGTAVWIEVTINEYNELNQLVGYTSINGDERSYSSYVYSGDNLRVQKTVDGEVTDYLLSGDYVIAETGKTYFFGMSYHGFATSEEEYLYFTNSHGDVTRVLGGDRTTVAAYDYDEFGNLTYEDSSIENDVLYSGEFYDSESKNYYLRARYYDPSIGRFTQQDTFLGVYDNPLSLNRYTYCHNNPIMFVDPSGHAVVADTQGDIEAVLSLIKDITQNGNWNYEIIFDEDGNFQYYKVAYNGDVSELDRSAISTVATDVIKIATSDIVGNIEVSFKKDVYGGYAPGFTLDLESVKTQSDYELYENLISKGINTSIEIEKISEIDEWNAGERVNFMSVFLHEMTHAITYELGIDDMLYISIADINNSNRQDEIKQLYMKDFQSNLNEAIAYSVEMQFREDFSNYDCFKVDDNKENDWMDKILMWVDNLRMKDRQTGGRARFPFEIIELEQNENGETIQGEMIMVNYEYTNPSECIYKMIFPKNYSSSESTFSSFRTLSEKINNKELGGRYYEKAHLSNYGIYFVNNE